ncbi:MAG TPA: septal ring lytic transglycosylase RlpA family protein [Solirubrobacterales bacterium]|nr:septal ring lytic transglycosylase RlpA family protein [Solirubrobacterales bacterium]
MGQASPAASQEDESARQATVQAKPSVRFGDRTKLRGEFPDSPDAEVAILHREAGEGSFRRVDSARTGPGGGWSARIKPRRTGDWRAELASAPADPLTDEVTPDSTSDTERIRVRSVTKVTAANRDVISGEGTEIRGKVLPAGQRDVIVKVGGQTKRAHADKNGRFEVDWKAPGTGKFEVRAQAKTNKDASGSKDSGGSITAYRWAEASWYGPGLYGNRTACGQTLTPSTQGVAHKSLPCGTKLSIRHGSREVHVRVIDRGPYVGNREFDLTSATKDDLGFSGTGRILVSK